jgi:hypothetical protein
VQSPIPLVSVVVNNYNYGRFLREAIDSALAQSYSKIEVIVVDDGSTDESRAVIGSYRGSITAIMQPNGGQASALNSGFAASRGEIVIFLDADDVLLATAAERAVGSATREMSKVHWLMIAIDADGKPTGKLVPGDPLPEGDLRELTLGEGPSSSVSAPTSGNAWNRSFLAQVMPMPEKAHRVGADAFLFGIAPAFGDIGRIAEPQSLYRIHGTNNYQGRPFEERLAGGLASVEAQWEALETHIGTVDKLQRQKGWRARSYFHRLSDALREIESCTEPGETVLVIDETRWALDPDVRGRRFLPFLELAGQYAGLPPNDAAAISEIDRMVIDYGAMKVAIAWQSFWWRDHYREFIAHLSGRGSLVLESANVMIFDVPARHG